MMDKNVKKEKNGWQRFRENIAGMSLEDKIDHIWTYYRGTVLLMILIPVAAVLLLTSILRKEPETVLYGNFTNVLLTQEGGEYLTQDYLQHLGLDPEAYSAEVEYAQTAGLSMSQANPHGVDGGIQVVAAVAVDMLDYIVCDRSALEFFAAQQSFLPLDRVLSPEELEDYGELLYSFTDTEFGDTAIVAVNVSELPFFQNCVEGQGEIYFGFANKTDPDTQALRQLLDYLQAWKKP